MCTVTFIPVKNKYFITSNRDETYSRMKAVSPAVYFMGKRKLLFPKDANAGGTWIALHENGTAAALLNGAFVPHVPETSYEKSRGIILLEIIDAVMPVLFFSRMDMSHIEPFTLVILTENKLYEARWDGNQKHCRQLRNNCSHIWSSATLYDDEISGKREQWLAAFLKSHPDPRQEDVLHFHQFAGNGDRQNGLRINRKGLVSTLSITSISMDNEKGNMKYLDLEENKMYESEIDLMHSLYGEAIC